MEEVAQIIGIVAMAVNVWSYQQKKQRGIIALQLFGSALFAVHFFMIGAYMGGLLNAIAIVRALVFLYKDELKVDHIAWLFGFIGVYLLCYMLTFVVFHTPFNGINALVEILPVIGMTSTTIAFRCKTSKNTRLTAFISSPAWLIYNIISFSIGAMCCDIISMVSIVVGYLRLDRNKVKKEDENL